MPGTWHTVRSGETLPHVARRHAVPIEDMEELNGIDRRDALEPGRQIFIPSRGRSAAVRRGSQRGAGRRGRAVQRFVWPVPGGKLTSCFGRRNGKMHDGIDIAAGEGDPIVAAGDGRVLYAGSGIAGYGNLVMIRHAGDLVTIYAHNRRNHVREGQGVRRGEVIAEVGRTGRATGFHLHFEVRSRDSPRDPLPFLDTKQTACSQRP